MRRSARKAGERAKRFEGVPAKTGENDGNRTRDGQYHKLELYQLSYVLRLCSSW